MNNQKLLRRIGHISAKGLYVLSALISLLILLAAFWQPAGRFLEKLLLP
jgi:Na+-transporting NADH:ubiquinone oxidoreductase subunit NqrB